MKAINDSLDRITPALMISNRKTVEFEAAWLAIAELRSMSLLLDEIFGDMRLGNLRPSRAELETAVDAAPQREAAVTRPGNDPVRQYVAWTAEANAALTDSLTKLPQAEREHIGRVREFIVACMVGFAANSP